MIVARPIGIVPMNIETTLWPKIRLASCPNRDPTRGVKRREQQRTVRC